MDMPCDVCRSLYGISTPNPTARYCSLCQKWLCDACRWSLGRVKVALKELTGKVA